jgi:ribosomal protein S18 acetylase RimI-like enzyme
MSRGDDISLEDVVIRLLDGPPEAGFDCGREDQNRFLYERAWEDQQEKVSTTYLYHVNGMIAGYATVCMDALPLGTRERSLRIRYKEVGALKLAQLGVDIRFQGRGLGALIVADVIGLAREISVRIGCRYVTLDAHPEVVDWYEKALEFKRNKLRQKLRLLEASGRRDPSTLAISMRFDIREP